MPWNNNIAQRANQTLSGIKLNLDKPFLYDEDIQNTLDANQRRLNAGLMFRNNLGNLAGIASGIASGPIGWVDLGVKALGDNIRAAKSQFDLAGFKDQINASNADFLQAAGSSNTTSDLLGLSSMVPDYNDYIDNQGYKWDGNILSGIGALIGNRRTENQKQLARNYQAGTSGMLSGAILNAQNRVSTNTYRQGMANYLNNAAMGGPLSTHGSDFTDDLIRIDVGGSHESNPLGGVPAGVDPNGIPNLVEEGETIWDNGDEEYVFSKRLKAPKALVKKFALGGGKKGLTYSEAARKASEKSGADLRPNDPISKRTKDAILTELEASQEEKRIAKEQRDAIKAMSEMSPEEFGALFTSQPLPQQAPMETQVPPLGVNEEMVREPSMQEPVGYEPTGLQGFAFGGNLFPDGGNKRYGRTKDGVFVEIIDRTDGNGTTWQELVPVEENGTINPSMIVGLPEVYATYQRPVQTQPNVFMRPYGDGFGGGARGGLSGTVYGKASSGASGVGFGGGTRGTIISKATGNIPQLKPEVSRYVDPNDFVGNLSDAVVYGDRRMKTVSTDQHGPFLPQQRASQRGSGSSNGSRRTSTPPTSVLSALNADVAADTDALADAILSSTPTIRETPINLGNDNFVINRMSTPSKTPESRTLKTWMRYAPIIGGGLSVLSDVFSRPDYSGYESLLADSRRLSSPVNIPVQTIGNRMRRNPFDERLSVNQANQNLAAGLRSTTNNAGGNRAYRQFANNLMAYNNQGQLSDIARNAYLANRQDAFQTAEFNRGTDMYNTSAINQRNLTQAQLNANRQSQGYYARANALNALENARRYDDQLASADLTAFLQSLGNLGRENFDLNRLEALRREGRYNIGYNGRTGDLIFSPTEAYTVAKGGKIKTKKRRF